ncbi:MAG: putative Ig domain-containing protein, partial [Leptospiraceae bacterium]|nr:putative Ig domain-containing protein [Leptospiraceae bacterium]
ILIQPPSSLTYPGSPFLFVQNSAIATQTPTVTGTISSCSSSPALPSGLSLNSANCVLSGTPTVLQGAANYTITATNSTGSTSTTISIEISDLPIQCLSYTSISGDDRYKALTNTTTLCDNTVMNGSWVRFTGTYSQLSTSSAGYSLCNTSATGYLNTALPSTRGQVVSGTVCYHWTTSNCEFSNTIQITHCGTYFVYQLPIPPNCSLRYCTQ